MNLYKRVVSGCIMGAIGIIAIILNAYFGFFVPISAAVITVACIYELLKCCEISIKNPYFWFVEIIDIVFIISFIHVFHSSEKHFIGQYLLISVYAIISFAFCICQKKNRRKLFHLSIIIFSIMISFGCLAYWSALYVYDGVNFNVVPLCIMLLCLLGGFVSDTAGYFVGGKFGKHKLAPRISPKKTVEGLIGSILAEPVAFVIVAVILSLVCPTVKINYFILIPISLLCAIVATCGDLSFSAVKRINAVKDFGNAIPGHGGFLDRFDSVVFTSIYITFAFSFLPVFS